MSTRKLESPPSEAVLWDVLETSTGLIAAAVAQTAFEAHRKACPQFKTAPAFGDCLVTRAVTP